MLGCGQASTSAIRKRMDRGWAGRSPGSWSGTSSSRSTERESQMFIRSDVVAFQRTLAFITLMAVIVVGTGSGAQDGMFSAGDAYERFMGRWSRELAPLLVTFAGVRDGNCGTGRRIGDGRTDGGCRRGCPVQSDHRDRSRGAVCCLRPGASSGGSGPVRGRRCPAACVRQWQLRSHALPSGAQLHPGSHESVG